jgi:hypothetical protein
MLSFVWLICQRRCKNLRRQGLWTERRWRRLNLRWKQNLNFCSVKFDQVKTCMGANFCYLLCILPLHNFDAFCCRNLIHCAIETGYILLLQLDALCCCNFMPDSAELQTILRSCILLLAYVPWWIAWCGAWCNFVSHLMWCYINLRCYVIENELFLYMGCMFVVCAITMGWMLYVL